MPPVITPVITFRFETHWTAINTLAFFGCEMAPALGFGRLLQAEFSTIKQSLTVQEPRYKRSYKGW